MSSFFSEIVRLYVLEISAKNDGGVTTATRRQEFSHVRPGSVTSLASVGPVAWCRSPRVFRCTFSGKQDLLPVFPVRDSSLVLVPLCDLARACYGRLYLLDVDVCSPVEVTIHFCCRFSRDRAAGFLFRAVRVPVGRVMVR